MDQDLVGSIYEAGAFPERWLTLLELIANATSARGGNFIRNNGDTISVISSPAIAEIAREFDRQGWNRSDSRVERLVARSPYPGFLTDADIHTEEELRTLPMYTEFLIPRGGDAGAATIIQGASHDALVVAFEGFVNHQAARGAVPVLDKLRPHLARAASLSSQVAHARNLTIVEAFDTVGVSIALLDYKGRVIGATELFAQAFDVLLRDGINRLRLVDAVGDKCLTSALLSLQQHGRGASIAVRHPQGEGQGILHLIPASRDARDLFNNVDSFAVLARPENRMIPGADIIAALFDLTPAEAKVARAIAHGRNPATVARDSNISVETVRAHLKRVFSKTASGSQLELATLINRLG